VQHWKIFGWQFATFSATNWEHFGKFLGVATNWQIAKNVTTFGNHLATYWQFLQMSVAMKWQSNLLPFYCHKLPIFTGIYMATFPIADSLPYIFQLELECLLVAIYLPVTLVIILIILKSKLRNK
jgi:hypothetical protein